MSAEERRAWVDAGRAALADADDHLWDDDFDGACRRYLLAAWCFGRAAGCAGVSPECRRDDRAAYRDAWQAARPLLPADRTVAGRRIGVEPLVEQRDRIAGPADPLTGRPQSLEFRLRDVPT